MDFLLNPIHDREAKIMEELGLPWNNREEIKRSKMMREFRQAATKEDREKAIKRVKEINQGMTFDFPRPVEASRQEKGQEHEKKGESEEDSKMVTEDTVEEVVQKALTEDRDNFMKLSHYGLKNFPLKKILEMEERHFGFAFQKEDVVISLPPEEVAEVLSHLIKKTAEAKKHDIQEECPQEFFQTLTTEQLEALRKKLPKLF